MSHKALGHTCTNAWNSDRAGPGPDPRPALPGQPAPRTGRQGAQASARSSRAPADLISGPPGAPRKGRHPRRERTPRLTEVVGGPEAPHFHILFTGGPALEDGGCALRTPRGTVSVGWLGRGGQRRGCPRPPPSGHPRGSPPASPSHWLHAPHLKVRRGVWELRPCSGRGHLPGTTILAGPAPAPSCLPTGGARAESGGASEGSAAPS